MKSSGTSIGQLLSVFLFCCAATAPVKGETGSVAWTRGDMPAAFINSIGSKLVCIKPGTFMMGSPLSEPLRKPPERQHAVVLTRAFYMGAYEVTQKEWKEVMSTNPGCFKGDDLPVEMVSWNDCQAFCKELTERERKTGRIPEGWGYRLPTEAEREYACRAGTTTPFHTGETLDGTQANINGENPYPGAEKGIFRGKTMPVGSFPPNAWGLYDMHGNVYEWCQDYWSGYPSEKVTDPFPREPHRRRVYRGGGWRFPADAARSAKRSQRLPDKAFDFMGFRTVLSDRLYAEGDNAEPTMTGEGAMPNEGKPLLRRLPIAGEVFTVSGRNAFLIMPGKPAAEEIPWVWYAPTFPQHPDRESWMFEQFLAKGIAIAGIDVGESYGSPEGRKQYSALYEELVQKRGLSGRPCLLARSRGGLMLYNWAAEQPKAVAGIAGMLPVCNLASFPGLKKASVAYGMTAEELEQALKKHNPIDRLEPIANAGVPIFHIHGDNDLAVPLDENSAIVAARYRDLGGAMTLKVIKGGRHDLSAHWFRDRELVDFIICCLLGEAAEDENAEKQQGE